MHIYKTRRRKDRIGWSKVLTLDEQRQVVQYLLGKTPSALTGEVLEQETVEAKRLRMIYSLFVNTGLRETELAMLRVRDCPKYLGADEIEVYRGKGNKDRSVEILACTRDDLIDYLHNWRLRTLPRHIKRDDVEAFVFYNNRKHRYFRVFQQKIVVKSIIVVKGKETEKYKTIIKSKNRARFSLYELIRNLGRHAGLTKKMYPHMLRHTFAVNDLAGSETVAPKTIYQVADRMGHCSIVITERYLHLVVDKQPITNGKDAVYAHA